MAENFFTMLYVGGTMTEAVTTSVIDIINNNFEYGTFDVNFKNPTVKVLEGNGDISYNEFEEIEAALLKLNVAFTLTMYPRDDYPGILRYNFPDLNLSGQTTSDGNGHSIIRLHQVHPILNLMMDLVKEGATSLPKHMNNTATKNLVSKMLSDPDNMMTILEKNLSETFPKIPELPELKIV